MTALLFEYNICCGVRKGKRKKRNVPFPLEWDQSSTNFTGLLMWDTVGRPGLPWRAPLLCNAALGFVAWLNCFVLRCDDTRMCAHTPPHMRKHRKESIWGRLTSINDNETLKKYDNCSTQSSHFQNFRILKTMKKGDTKKKKCSVAFEDSFQFLSQDSRQFCERNTW